MLASLGRCTPPPFIATQSCLALGATAPAQVIDAVRIVTIGRRTFDSFFFASWAKAHLPWEAQEQASLPRVATPANDFKLALKCFMPANQQMLDAAH